MNWTPELIVSALGLVGLGGLLSTFASYFIGQRRVKFEAQQSFKETRYKTIILLCYAYVNYDREGLVLTINRPDIQTKERLEMDLGAEWINMALFASDNVIRCMKQLLHDKNQETFRALLMAMRQDLFGVKTKLTVDDWK